MHGSDGGDLTLRVPVGTLIREVDEQGVVGEIIADLSDPHTRLRMCR